jgi:hypothetical protein
MKEGHQYLVVRKEKLIVRRLHWKNKYCKIMFEEIKKNQNFIGKEK